MRSLQIHPPPSPPHTLPTATQRVPKTPHGRTVMPTRPDPPVAAPGDLVALNERLARKRALILKAAAKTSLHSRERE